MTENNPLSLEEPMALLEAISQLILNKMPSAEYSSLLNDFVESEFFLIDGDSLLITCICEKSLKQGQSLHFFYLVECYLLDLINKGGHFAVVFFKDAECAYFSFPELLPLRTALILHLQKNTTVDVWTEFSRCFSREWETCLKETCPYFLIVADEGLNQLQTHLFNFLIIHCWAMRVNIVLFSGQASGILRLYAYFLPTSYDDVKLLSKNRTQIWTVYKSLLKQLEENRTSAVAPLFRDLQWDTVLEKASETISLLKKLWPERSDVQCVFCVTSCSLFLQINHDFLPKKKKAISSKNNNKQQGSCLGLAEMKDFCKLHCLTMAFLLNLPLPQRARSRFITAPWIKAIQTLFKMKKWCDYFILSNKSLFRFWDLNSIYLSDLTDDVLLKNIAFYYENENADGLHLHLGKTIMKDYEYLWNTVSKLVRTFDVGKPFPLRTSKLHFLKKKLSPIKGKRFMKCVLCYVWSDDPIVMSLVKQKEFDELVHWHSHRPLSDDYDRTKANFNAKSRDPQILKSLQKHHIFQRLYGNSLESVSSKLIVTQGVKAKKDFHEAKSIKKHETKAELIAKENKKRLLAKEEQKDEQKWNALSLSIEEEMKKNLNSGIKKLEDFLKSCKSNSVKVQGEMVGLMACLKTWKEHCKAEGKIRKDLSIVVQIMKRIQSLVDKYSELLQEADWKFIAKCLKYLRFDELASSLYPTQDTDDINNKKKSKYSVGIGPARFQLQYMGHYLVREERKDPDPRVQDFIPDTWQRELLDVVDNYESAVIVAPTSSGKTYASYYCMERVLKESDEGVVVYVAPTKALVNQVAATVQHRYTKNLPSGEALCGVFTREYRHDALNCQVLVTVPACFEILLLSPHRQQWVKRIRYVIFDEVHCLGGEIGAEIWEHLLVMIRCPFLALSATISNPEHLVEWLQSTRHYWKKVDSVMKPNIASETKAGNHAKNNFQIQQSHKVRLVLYGERYNDLEKYICSVKNDDICFDHYHPCAALTTDHIERYGFPSDLALSPRESLQLYDTMCLIWKEWPQAQTLCPENFIHFKNKVVIKKSDARKYEESLKSELTSWVKDGNIKQVKKVLKHLNPHSEFRSGNLLKKFPLLVEKLNEMNQLPAIFFIFNLTSVEMCAVSVGKSLEKKEEEKRPPKADKEIHVMVSKLQKFKKSMEKQKIVEGKKQRKTRKLDQSLYHEAQYNHLLQSLEENLKMPQDCTYADYKVIDSEYLQMVFKRVKFERKGDQLKALARRGVGYHYSAMSAKEKQLVEILFRKGFIRVVTATGTLALGVNMPCKSVVFAQNSVYLDALNYRQMSGRAGRRGQDLLGNVYFFDIPQPKVEKLIKSKVPELRGQFPFSITLILRLLLLASKADDQEDGQAKVLSVLKHSLLSFKQPKIMEILKLYFLFTLQLLVKEGYIDRDGNPTGFAGLVSHLHYHEPSNLVFVNFLVNGLFHKLCQPTKKGSKRFSEDTMRKLVLVLANLFGRRFLPAKLQDADTKFYQSKNILRTLGISYAQAPLLLPQKFDSQGRRMPLNAYILDFYKHGSLKGLVQDNRINEGEAYNLLKDFSLTVKSISVSLRELCENEDDNVVLAFEQLSETFSEKFKKI
ncbi:PREDICTED: probable ATP-dependent RNA helicase DDX60 [Dipodomys ordii]|uniref:Probable ATP-dependent RNA helicase DDX60 n=1 Tax=Dipodomys ordii TaxID=10020 RepID=A0A1S3FRI8_DIPOR|nr:PREDICTED: probable ATP-dependent RNA helicase DDX60 [Dipodomys ordii]